MVRCTELAGQFAPTQIDIPPSTRLLDLSQNTHAFQNIALEEKLVWNLVYLNLSNCQIRNISSSTLFYMRNLIVIDLSSNHLTNLPSRMFISQTRLKVLKLDRNKELLKIESEAFKGLESLKHLALNHIQITRIFKSAFAFLNLDVLDLSRNTIKSCDDNAFEMLSVKTFYLNSTDISEFSGNLFKGIERVSLLVTRSLKYCCMRPYFISEANCFPQKDEFSSCEDLMRNDILRPLLWIVGFLALIGNILALAYRIYDKKRLKLGYGIFVTNLSISDFLMGIYLIIIASADMHYRGGYIFHDDYWRHSFLCKLAGVLATMSSEASILFICLITLDRFLVVKYPLGEYRLTQKPAWISSAVSWLISIGVAMFPLVYKPFAEDGFYSRSGVCIALPLTRDRHTGWLYSVLLFIGFNFLTIIMISIGQWLIFSEVTSTAKKVQSKSKTGRKRELRVARNLLLVATTDFMCWFPIGILGRHRNNATTLQYKFASLLYVY